MIHKWILWVLLLASGATAQSYTFNELDPIEQRTVVLTGDKGSKDQSDRVFSAIRIVNGNLRIERVDNAVFDGISIENGCLEIVSARQCHFGPIQVSKCTANFCMRIRSDSMTRGDASNNCHFESIMIRNCDSDVYLDIQGGGKPGGLDTARDMVFGFVFLHCPWEGSGEGPEATTKDDVEHYEGAESGFRFTERNDRSRVLRRLCDCLEGC